MTYPWAAGEVLTAADLNAYAGWIYSSKTAVGSGVSDIDITCDGFDDYLVVFDRVDASANRVLIIDSDDLSASVWGYTTLSWDQSATPTLYNGTLQATAQIGLIDTNKSALSIMIQNPNNSGRTRIYSQGQYGAGVFVGSAIYQADTTTTSFTFTLSSGSTFSGGTVYVYGRNNG